MINRIAFDSTIPKIFLVPFTGKLPKVPIFLELLIPHAEAILRKFPTSEVYTYSSGGNVFIFWQVRKTTRSAPSVDNLNAALDKLEEIQGEYSYIIVLDSEDEQLNAYLKMVFKKNYAVVFNY